MKSINNWQILLLYLSSTAAPSSAFVAPHRNVRGAVSNAKSTTSSTFSLQQLQQPQLQTNRISSTTSTTKIYADVSSEVKMLRAQAKRTKLEAKKLELEVTRAKIQKLEQKLEQMLMIAKVSSSDDDSMSTMSDTDAKKQKQKQAEDDLREEVEFLQMQLEAIASGKKQVLVRKVSKTRNTNMATTANSSNVSGDSEASSKILDRLLGRGTSSAGTNLEATKAVSKPLEPEELATAVQFYQRLPEYMRRRLANAVNMTEEANDVNVIVRNLYEQREKLLSKNGPLSAQKDGKIKVVVNTDAMTIGGAAANGQSKGESSSTEEMFDLTSPDELMEYLKDMDGVLDLDENRNDRFMSSMYPDSTRKYGDGPSEEQALEFFNDILVANRKGFSPKSKPEKVAGGWLIRGTSTMDDNESMVASIEAALQESPLAEKLQFFYVRDPLGVAAQEGDAMFEPVELSDIWGEPVIMLMSPDVSPDRNVLAATLTTVFALACTAIFSIEAFGNTADVMNRVQAAQEMNDYDLNWLNERSVPIFLSILATQVAHETAHQIVAIKGKFKTCAPTFIPSPILPQLTSITKLKTPPRNLRDLFDFAAAGPIVGMLASAALLVYGAAETNAMDAASYAMLPSLPLELIKSSSLGANILNSLMGNQLLIQNAPSIVPLHPTAIAGFCGLIVNALSLLPIGQSDGGRIAMAVFGRNGHVLASFFAYSFIFGSALFGFDSNNILLFYGIFSLFANRELEIPCLNEIDDIDLGRSFLAIFGSVIVGLTLIPIT